MLHVLCLGLVIFLFQLVSLWLPNLGSHMVGNNATESKHV